VTPLVGFIRSDPFQRHHQAVNKFLLLLGWLYLNHPKEFADAALGFRRGNRRYFAKSQKEIEQSGNGIAAKAIPQSPFWVLTTLDNKSKRIIIEDLLQILKYSRGDINLTLAELRDSEIRRGSRDSETFQQLREIAERISTNPSKT
jgi:negative modulator of initiation of replication